MELCGYVRVHYFMYAVSVHTCIEFGLPFTVNVSEYWVWQTLLMAVARHRYWPPSLLSSELKVSVSLWQVKDSCKLRWKETLNTQYTNPCGWNRVTCRCCTKKGIATACHLLHLPSVNAEYLSIAFPRVGTNCWRITTGKSHVTPAYMSECIVGYMH